MEPSRPVTQGLLVVLRKIFPAGTAYSDGAIYVDDDYWRAGPFFTVGETHGGYDFYYRIDSGLNGDGHPPVFSPVSGEVIFVGGSQNAVWVKDGSGYVHRILYLDDVQPLPVQVGQIIGERTYLGNMGSTGVTENHVHYDILLPGVIVPGTQGYSAEQLEATWNKIDPQVYWTIGLQVTSTALRDINGDGIVDTSGTLREGETSLLSVEVNTPHTQALTVRVEFKGLPPNSLAISGAGVVSDANDSNVAFITLPVTVDQRTPNTSFTFRVTPNPDADFTSEAVKMDLVPVYKDGTNWYAIPGFTPVTDRSLIVFDNDIPQEPTDINVPPLWDATAHIQRNGTELDDRAGTSDTRDFDSDGDNDLGAVNGTANADRIHGQAGDDDVFGRDGGDFLYGNKGKTVFGSEWFHREAA